MGLVTDTLQIGRVADATVYMCRADYTPKESFGLINGLAAEKKLPNMSIVLNGIDMSKKKATHKFLLDFKDKCDKPIKLPEQEWNGDFLDKREETSTIVYVFPLIRLIEKIIANVVNEYKIGKLRFCYMEEIKARFTIKCN